MNAGRWILLPAVFLGLALVLTGSSVRAQDRSPHKIWQQKLTPEQLKAALARLGDGGDNIDQFRDQILDLMKQQKQLGQDDMAKALEILNKHPELLEHAKRFAKQRQVDPGRPGQLAPEDLGKLFQVKPGQPFQVPDPKNFEPPKFDPAQPGMVEPPMGGKIDQPPGKVDQPPVVPPQPPPPPPGGEKKTITIDENPFPPPQTTDPRAKSLEAFAAVWERNVGPLSETPEVKRALFDLIGENGFDFDFKDDKGNSFWDLLKNGDGTDFGDFFGGTGGSGSWFGDFEFPKFDWWGGGGGGGGGGGSSSSWWSSLNWGSSSSTPRPSSPSGWGSGGGGGFSIGGLGGAWVPFVILLVIILAVVIWFQLQNIKARAAAAVVATDGLGPWPIDPRQINTREDVVKAFEYLSVLICGPSAKTWTHSTIADALTDLAATQGEKAVMLARLYELARYAPLDEPLTRDELIEARGLVCSLAGVSY